MSLEDRVREYYSTFSDRNLKELEAMFTDDSLIIDFRGVEHHSTGVVRMFELFPAGCRFQPVSLTSDGNTVVTGFRLTGGPPGRAQEGKDIFIFYGDRIRVLHTQLPPA